MDSRECRPQAAHRYIGVVYDQDARPRTDYPARLAAHLCERFSLRKGQILLEPGCGRGEFLQGFQAQGLDCRGCDLSPEAAKFLPDLEVLVCDVDRDPLPYADDSLDVVYSKSVLEHLHHPEQYLAEAYRVLRPGGLCITMVPDWEANYQIYFDDYTHRTPFTTVSLTDIYRMCGYGEVSVVRFRQLPVVWKYPALNLVSALIAPFVPLRAKNKFLRWSRELMLLGAGRKVAG